ncbi:uracil phosphoribosyltransferase-domain-containing protein [Catenaria anguillulae PL171]|uniref:Uridine kinase n=1 Tax=Catenaria anguillulae PL171 TaxID=765915 RepID=A0A1Y2HXE3_9FUNG|nr:uracil phosphoribosyltransferase-domain-containing protein [Catenaria anguillulae PL171]
MTCWAAHQSPVDARTHTHTNLTIPRMSSRTSSTYVSGRMPWYTMDGAPQRPYIVGMAGGSASGKTTVAQRILKSLGPQVVLLSMDSFYKSLTDEQIAAAHRNEHDFDSPDSFDYELLFDVLNKLKEGKRVEVPVYDFNTHSRLKDKTTPIYGANVVIFEGIFALYDAQVRSLMDLKIFVDTDSDIRLARRLLRDIAERGRDAAGVLKQYHKFVKPAYDNFIGPTIRHADVIIPRGKENLVAIDLITKHIIRQLDERGQSFRHLLAKQNYPATLPANVLVMEPRGQLKALHTIIRDATTCRDDFIYYSERLSCLVVERALAEFPYEPLDVQTPTGDTYKGLRPADQLCGVSIIRSGATMEASLRRVSKDAQIGKLLIQSSPVTGEPELHYCKLPQDIAQRAILLMDATIATGACAMMAIRVLLDHNVPEDRIVLATLIAAPPGLHAVARAFPKVRVVVSEVDAQVNERYWILPGVGNFGDRYFGSDD